jgi:integrase
MSQQNSKSVIKISKFGQGGIAVSFSYNTDFVQKIKTVAGFKWHPDKKYWSVLSGNDIIDRLASLFEGERLNIDTSLRIEGKKTIPLEDLRRGLISRKYSPKTIKAYVHYNEDLLRVTKKSPSDIANEDIKNYLLYLADEKDSSASTLNMAINALKFYYGEILKKNFAYEIKRPKKDKKLPIVLSREEVLNILSSVKNLKHRAILMLTYSAGLRVSEVVKLKLEDIDTERKLIHMRGAKGRKDRYTIILDVAMNTLKLYIEFYHPENWLFLI